MDYEKIVKKYLKNKGRLISSSKGQYSWDHPRNIVLYNSNLYIIIDNKPIKIWYGDLDLTTDEQILKKIAEELDQEILIIHEHGDRDSEKVNINNFIIKVNKNESVLNDTYMEFCERVNNKWMTQELEKQEEKVLPVHFNSEEYKKEEFVFSHKISIDEIDIKHEKLTPLDQFNDNIIKHLKSNGYTDYKNISIYITNKDEDRIKELVKR